MKFDFDFETGKVQLQAAGDKSQLELSEILNNVNASAIIDTGLLPVEKSGLLSLRMGFGRTQYVYQIEPQKHIVIWGEYEGEEERDQYVLAEPWKIIIADFQDGAFLGLRHFYSPEQIWSFDQPLYAINLPNTNTIGYNGTSIGWTCLYRNHDTTGFSIPEQINYFIERESGANEPYNNANMSETDGPRFYCSQGKPEYMWDPFVWQEKTTNEGIDWILNPDNLIPIKINWDNDPGATEYNEYGDLYTLGDAMFKTYYAYYPGHVAQPEVLPINLYKSLKDEGKNPWEDADFQALIPNSWRTGKQAATAKKKKSIKPLIPSTTEEILALLRKPLQLTEEQKNLYLSDGILCVACNIKKPGDSPFFEVITKYHYAVPETDDISSLIIDVIDSWCQNCTLTKASKIQTEKAAYAKLVFDISLLAYSLVTDTFYLKESVINCPSCLTYLGKQDMSAHMYMDLVKLDLETTRNIIDGKIQPVDVLDKYGCCSRCRDLFPEYQDFEYDSHHIANPMSKIKFVVRTDELDNIVGDSNDMSSGKLLRKYTDYNIDVLVGSASAELVGQQAYMPTLFMIAMNRDICPCDMIAESSDPCNHCVDEKGYFISRIKTVTRSK